MNLDNETQLGETLTRYIAGDCSPEETRELSAHLERDQASCELLTEILMQGVAVREFAQANPETMRQTGRLTTRWQAWFQWPALKAAAAGLLFGLLTASIVWAYIPPLTGKTVTLLKEDFESSSAPVVSGVALEPGIWRGDYAQIVGEEQGMKPASGVKMLRFLRADYQGKPKSAGNHLADIYRLIDVRPYRYELADGGAVAQVSASFNAIPFPSDEKYGCALSIYAVDAETAPSGPSYIGTALTADSLAMARSNRTKLDRDPVTWQRLTTELRLPANTDFVVVRLHISQGFDSLGKAAFTGFYADDVHVSLTRRAPLP